MTLTKLSWRQQEFYDNLVAMHTELGYAPTLEEMKFARSAQNAFFYCKKLTEMGWIEKINNRYIPIDSPVHPSKVKAHG